MATGTIANSFLRDRDREILDILTTKVIFMSRRQIADEFFQGDMANTVRRLETLEEKDLLASFRLNARTSPVIDSPLVEWAPGHSSLARPPSLSFSKNGRYHINVTPVRKIPPL